MVLMVDAGHSIQRLQPTHLSNFVFGACAGDSCLTGCANGCLAIAACIGLPNKVYYALTVLV